MSTFFKSYNLTTTHVENYTGGDPVGATRVHYTCPANRFAIAEVRLVPSSGNATITNTTTSVGLDSSISANVDIWTSFMVLPGQVVQSQKTSGVAVDVYVNIYEFYIQSPV